MAIPGRFLCNEKSSLPAACSYSWLNAMDMKFLSDATDSSLL